MAAARASAKASAQARYDRLIATICHECPGFRIIRKDHCLWQRWIHLGLMAVTLGGMRGYLDGYQTTIGRTVYVTPDWDERDPADRYVIMCHERIHLRQFRRYTFLGMAFLYLLVPLPMGAAYFRARFEREAYEETLRAAAEVHGIAHIQQAEFRERIVKQFLGPSYGWMWPFRRSIDAWYERTVARVNREVSGG